jgi:uncharacterized protein YmfQ (DUF2313 family)
MDVTRTAKWLSALQALLPPGVAITREPDANVTKLLESWAAMMGDAELSFEDWLAQYDPNQATTMLADWERFLGLPDCCDAGVAQTLQQRRAAVVEKLYVMGGNSPQYFIDMMARRGIAIAIQELGNHVWKVTTALVNLHYFRAGQGRCGERLRTWGNAPEARAHPPRRRVYMKGLYQ